MAFTRRTCLNPRRRSQSHTSQCFLVFAELTAFRTSTACKAQATTSETKHGSLLRNLYDGPESDRRATGAHLPSVQGPGREQMSQSWEKLGGA